MMELNPENKPRVLVCQRGARHRYAIPRMLESAGMLEALYTDSVSHRGLGRIARTATRLGAKATSVQALAARCVEGVPDHKVFGSDRVFIARVLKGMMGSDLSSTYCRWGLRGANVVYSMYGEDIRFLEWARDQGAKIMVDVFVHPATNRIIAEEALRCQSSAEMSEDAIQTENEHSVNVFRLADMLICPSEWVAEGVRDFDPDSAGKIRVIPYGSSLRVNAAINAEPQPGRILFAGRDPMRKGLHYLAAAAQKARASGLELDVRVAGVAQESVSWIEHGQGLRCLGRLPMDQMRQEYEQADLFVLPSLSEGQAGVILEAMACGCPVIATRESGVDFLPDGGIAVPVRNADALAKAIAEVVGDRARRNQLAQGALQQAGLFTTEAWQKRLVDAVTEVQAM